ncbi:hypothetical protein ERJ75_000828500 [Trypanosoma vivax]|uniref:Uncharacterized protein n=1 Tax=Trypanosoma vivax (strain Y486) TaxID=1055687 RepID=G0TZ49_TRYVY|nr:hypothetical protein TRVL_04618 [Trypanosoma vivax]KAH8612968.1 hypothetical protein ERJ75_000828500 [Trypanosoma vivax]CCC49252.1 conserved hypothetical protein [Trypanosoma vivax Y486]
MHVSAIARRISSGITLTRQIEELGQRLEQHVGGTHGSVATAITTHDPPHGAGGGRVDELWEQVLSVGKSAHALKETDSLLSVVFHLLRRKLYPSPNTAAAIWPALVRDLVPYSDIEACSVLAYPGVPEPLDETSDAPCCSTHTGAGDDPPNEPPLLWPTRDTLLLTGGVIPLSARLPCSDGASLSLLLNAFCECFEAPVENKGEAVGKAIMGEMCTTVLSALRSIAATVLLTESSPVTSALVRFLRLIAMRSADGTDGKNMEQVEDFAENLADVLSNNAAGARVLVQFILEQHNLFPEELLHLPLVRIAARSIWHHYKTPDPSFPLRECLQRVNDAVDVTFQRNANSNNPLQLQEEEEADLRMLLALSLLRAMRLQAPSPDVFLREAIDIVDNCPSNPQLEYELIAAKIGLLDIFSEDESSCSAIYDDLLQSLRALVELRPREMEGGTHDACTTWRDSGPAENTEKKKVSQQEERRQRHLKEDKDLLKRRFQEAHQLVVAAFSRSLDQERLNQAYIILVAHKYHGLVITSEIANPLLEVLSRRGDCRVFNIVDLCVLYSGSNIDYDTLTCLFRACRVAGDFYRARTLFQLLREMIPGFLLRAPEAIREMLCELKVLEPEPKHLFSDAQLAGTEVGSDTSFLPESLLEDELLHARPRGPLRDLPVPAVEKQKQKQNVTGSKVKGSA